MENRNNEAGEKAVRVYTVRLEGMEFFAHHGCLEEEKINGNSFCVDFEGEFASDCAETDDLERTINYGCVYRTVAAVMGGRRCNLLETLAANCVDAIARELPGFRNFRITVGKKNPPVGGSCSWSKISLDWKNE